MKNMISSAILIVGGLVLFFVFGSDSDFGIVGIICIIVGVLGIFFPKINDGFLKMKSKDNLYALILFMIILIPSLIYIWYKLHS